MKPARTQCVCALLMCAAMSALAQSSQVIERGAKVAQPSFSRVGGNHASISGSPLERVARDLLVRASSFITTTLAASNITEHVAVQASNVAPR